MNTVEMPTSERTEATWRMAGWKVLAKANPKPTVRAIAHEGEESDYRISSFIIGVVKSDPFRMRMADVVAEENMENGGP